jgi:hypothetical protein
VFIPLYVTILYPCVPLQNVDKGDTVVLLSIEQNVARCSCVRGSFEFRGFGGVSVWRLVVRGQKLGCKTCGFIIEVSQLGAVAPMMEKRSRYSSD